MNTHVLAADEEALDEAFLLFLASGLEMDGQWHDPVSLGEMMDVEALTTSTEDDLPVADEVADREEEKHED